MDALYERPSSSSSEGTALSLVVMARSAGVEKPDRRDERMAVAVNERHSMCQTAQPGARREAILIARAHGSRHVLASGAVLRETSGDRRVYLLIIGVVLVVLVLLWQAGASSSTTPDGAGEDTVDRVRLLAPDNFRVSGETMSLLSGVLGLILVFLVLLRVTFGAILGLLVISVLWLKARQGQLLGHAVKVGPNQLPAVFEEARAAAENLCMPMPDVFVVQSPVINAFAMGFVGRKSVVLHSAIVEALEPDELAFVIGHEFTHIKASHTHWLIFTSIGDTIRLPIVSEALGFLLRGWSRRAEYTADRGGLIASQDLRAAIRAIAKLAVGPQLFDDLDINELLRQKDAVDADLVSKFGETLGSHPYIVNRVSALHDFSRTPYFHETSRVQDVASSGQSNR